MKFAAIQSNRYMTTRPRKTASQPLFETCEARQLMSGSPLNFAGEYAAFDSGHVLAVNIRHGSTATSYSGDVDTAGSDVQFTASENSSNVLGGSLATSPKATPFTATLSGKTLTLSYTGTSTKYTLYLVNPTPGAIPPALVSHSTSEFKYSEPSSWKVSQGSDGILLSSSDGTEQVGVFATEANGIYTASQIAASEKSHGATILTSSYLANGSVSSHEYKQAGIGLIEFSHSGTEYVSGQIIETLNYTGVGTYNAKTKTYSGETVALLFEVTATKAEFPGIAPTLINILTSIHLNAVAKNGTPTVSGGSKVPGISGS